MTRHRFARLLIAVLITSLSVLPVAAQPSAPPQAAKLRPAMDPGKLKAMLMNTPTGSPLRLRTTDGAQVDGKLTQVTNDGVEIQALTNGNIENRKLGFGDISTMKTGQRKSGFAAALSPVLTLTSLLGTAAAITAAIRK